MDADSRKHLPQRLAVVQPTVALAHARFAPHQAVAVHQVAEEDRTGHQREDAHDHDVEAERRRFVLLLHAAAEQHHIIARRAIAANAERSGTYRTETRKPVALPVAPANFSTHITARKATKYW